MTNSIGIRACICIGAAVLAFGAWRYGFGRSVFIGVFTASVLTGLGWLQRGRPRQDDGWKLLTASPMERVGLVGGLGVTGVMTYAFYFVGSARDDAAFQMLGLQCLVVAFALGTAMMFYLVFATATRWNDDCVEQSGFGYAQRRIRYGDICSMRLLGWAGVMRFDAVDGTTIYVPVYKNGSEAFFRELTARLGPTESIDDEL